MIPYFAANIDDMVETIDEDRIYKATMKRDRSQLEDYSRSMDMLGMTNTQVLNSRLYQFTQSCIAARRQQLENVATLESYEPPIEVESEQEPSFWNPWLSLVGIVTAWHFSGVIGDKLADWTGMSVDHDEIDRLLK